MKLKYHRVAVSGPTIDGREITPAQIDQMAKNYDPAKKYGARVWVEHLRSLLPDNPFKAYGDVLALKAETEADGKRGLYAQVEATPDLIKLRSDSQKVYWSIEMDPNFAGTGEAYMVGLAVTDSPASLGTEMLTFALKDAKAPEEIKAHLFSAAVEAEIAEDEPEKPSFLARVKELISSTAKTADTPASQTEAGVLAIAEEVAALRNSADGFAAKGDVADLRTEINAEIAKWNASLDGLIAKLSQTPLGSDRSPASGAAANMTDC